MNRTSIFSPVIIFITLVFFVVFSQIILLKPIIGQGITNEDILGFFKVRLYKDQMFTDPLGTWRKIGLHDATHDFYIGFLDRLFGADYTLYLYSSIFLKILATLLLYPLILIISKNRLLAFLGTFLYGISYPSVGALYLYVVGNEYLGVALMLLLLIIYYYCIKRPTFILFILISIITSIAYLASPTRIFPVFLIILVIELFKLLKSKFFKPLHSLIRLALIFLPIMWITMLSSGSDGAGAYSLIGWPDFFKKITDGNWYFLLNPIWGFGYTFLPASSLRFLGTINISSLLSYLGSLLGTAYIIFGTIALFLSFSLSHKRLRFFATSMLINLILDIVVFILYTHHFGIPSSLVIPYAGPSFTAGLYSGIIAVFIFSLSITCGIEWYLTEKNNRLLFLSFIFPFLSLLFISSQWIFTRDYYMYQEGIHRYFVIPAIWSYLFIASILVVSFQNRKPGSNLFISILILLILFFIFNISRGEIAQLFLGKKGSGKVLKIQESMQNQTLSYIPRDKLKEDLLIYIKFASDTIGDANQWEDTLDWRDLTFWMHIKKSYLMDTSIGGCVALTWDFQELQKMSTIQNGSKGFLYTPLGNKEIRCFLKGAGYSIDGKFLNIDNLYAFSVKGPKVINITEEMKRSLIFNHE